jgi:hypothetical protein
MSLFGKSPAKAVPANTVAATAVAVTELPADLEAEALARVRELKAELARLDGEMKLFKQQFRVSVNIYGVILHCECGLLERGHVERQWRFFLKRRDAAIFRWHAALRAWSALKEVRNGQTKTEVNDGNTR